MNMNTQATQA